MLIAVLTIHIEILWNLTPYLCRKSGLAILGFAIYIHKILESNPLEQQGKAVCSYVHCVSRIWTTLFKIRNGGLVLGSSQFPPLLQLP